jgi:hypothetical protein
MRSLDREGRLSPQQNDLLWTLSEQRHEVIRGGGPKVDEPPPDDSDSWPEPGDDDDEPDEDDTHMPNTSSK